MAKFLGTGWIISREPIQEGGRPDDPTGEPESRLTRRSFVNIELTDFYSEYRQFNRSLIWVRGFVQLP